MKKLGFSLSFSIICKSCGFEDQFFSSTNIKQEINICSVMTFYKTDRGSEAMVTFTFITKMPLPMNKNNFDAINDKLI